MLFSTKTLKLLAKLGVDADGIAQLAEAFEADLALERTKKFTDSDLEYELRAAAGWEHEPSSGLGFVAPIRELLAEGADLFEDVLPIIMQKADRVDARTSWKYFVPVIKERMEAKLVLTPEAKAKYAARVYVKAGSKAWDAWAAHYKRTGAIVPRDSRGGWWFESEYPPETAA